MVKIAEWTPLTGVRSAQHPWQRRSSAKLRLVPERKTRMLAFNVRIIINSLTKPEAQHRSSRVASPGRNIRCFFVAFGLLLTYLFFLLFPFHWPTLALFAGLAVVIALLTFTHWPLVAGWSTLVASTITLLYGLLYAYSYQEYGLLMCSALFVVAFVVLRLIFRSSANSMSKVRTRIKMARGFLSFIMALTVVGVALPLSILPNPKMYLATALAFTQAIAYNSSRVNWPQVNKHALAMIRDAGTSQETYPAIEYILSQLQDHHSFFWDPQLVNELQTGRRTGPGFLTADAQEWPMNKNFVVAYVYPGSAADKAGIRAGDIVSIISLKDPIMTLKWKSQHPQMPEQLVRLNMKITYNTELGSNGKHLTGNIGYVNMYGTIADDYAMKIYADRLQRVIRQVDTQPVCGWILDLRLNQGGYLESMIQGIGPILGEGKNLVKYVDIQGNIIEGYGYKHGALLDQNGNVVSSFIPISHPYQLKIPNPPVAILISPNTASAGEGTLMAFLGRANTHTFGEHTYGVPTGDGGLSMIDGAKLIVMIEIGSDHTGKTYQSTIAPDESVSIDWKQYGTDQDPVMLHAQHWLEGQIACKV